MGYLGLAMFGIDLAYLTALLFAAIFLGIEGEQLRAKYARKKWNNRKYKPSTFSIKPQSKEFDAAEQLRCVMDASYTPRKLLNKSESRLFQAIEQLLLEKNSSLRVMAQVSLGEIISSPKKDAYRAINSKRVDMLIVDNEHNPIHVIEYQGTGHHQGTAAARDAIKKEALRRAGIGFSEVIVGDRLADLRTLIDRITKETRRAA